MDINKSGDVSMFKIHKYTNQIDLTRGNTMRTEIGIETDEGEYVPESGDVITFSVKKKPNYNNPIIEKIISNDTMLLELSPEDTKNLEKGSYDYDVTISLETGDVYTFIEGKLVLKGM